MQERSFRPQNSMDRAVAASLIIPAVLMPASAYALQVGCFFTAVFLSIMFVVCLGLAELAKHLIARHVWKLPRTPWLRFFALTWLELLLGIAVFASVRTNFWVTALIYLPLAALANWLLLGRIAPRTEGGASSTGSAYAVFLLLAAVLPLSLQVSGILWRTVTNVITFTEIQ